MKKTKKYALNNSYFKNRYGAMPDTILEIAKYQQETGELPFEYNGENWVYDAFVERQKRKGVNYSQYLTPDKTAEEVSALAEMYFEPNANILDVCSGTGQLAKKLLDKEFSVTGIDVDFEMVELCKTIYQTNLAIFEQGSFEEYTQKHNYIVSNPPYENMVGFFEFLHKCLEPEGICILIVPATTWDKDKPKRLVELKSNFVLLERQAMKESFARTNVNAEIIVLEKKAYF